MNKSNFKYTIWYQLLRPTKNYTTLALFFVLFWMLTINLWTSDTGALIFSIAGLISYFFSVYNSGFDAAVDDKKSCSLLKPKWYKGIFLPALLTIAHIIAILIFKCSWYFGTTDGYISNGWALTGNIFSIMWFSPYKTIGGINRGNIEMQGYIITFILPYIASFLGYLAGYKNFDIYGKLSAIAYERKKK